MKWHLRQALVPLLFQEEGLEAWQVGRDPVAPETQAKKNCRQTSDGLELHSFSTLMQAPATRCHHQCRLRHGLCCDPVEIKIFLVNQQVLPKFFLTFCGDAATTFACGGSILVFRRSRASTVRCSLRWVRAIAKPKGLIQRLYVMSRSVCHARQEYRTRSESNDDSSPQRLLANRWIDACVL